MALEGLWVDGRYRGRGYGRALLTRAERIVKAHGCVAVQGCCFSFQAAGFLHRLGYKSFGVVDVYLGGHTEDFLIKRLHHGRSHAGASE
jgi:GNAT superfamily N-acetyltransferase